MPTYVYAVLDDAGQDTGQRFEDFAPMSAPALEHEPGTGRPCRRVPVVPHIVGNNLEIIDWQMGAPPGDAQDIARDQTPSCTTFTGHGAAVYSSARQADRVRREFDQSHEIARKTAAEQAERQRDQARRGVEPATQTGTTAGA